MFPNNANQWMTKRSLMQRWRRGAVVATYGGYLTMVSVWYVASRWASAGLFLLVIAIALLMLLGLALLLTSWVWHAANEPDAQLDERQLQVRNRAYLHSYQGVATVLVLCAFYGALAWDNGWWLPQTWNQIQSIMWGVLLLALTLPAAVIAWTQPDVVLDA